MMQRTNQYQLCPSTSHSILILTIESPSLIKAFLGPEPLSSISTISGVPCQALEPLNAVKSGLGFNLPGLCWLALKRAGSPYLLPRVSWTHGFKNMMTRPPQKKMDKTSFPKSRHSWRQMIIQSGVDLEHLTTHWSQSVYLMDC